MQSLLLVWLSLLGQFEVASVKPSARLLGPDYGNAMTYTPNGFSAKNTTLKRLIAEAYNVRPFQVQVTSGIKWLDSAEYDVVAQAGGGASRQELRLMLQDLLRERFRVSFHREKKEMRVYNLLVGPNGPKLKPGPRDLDQFAAFLAVQLSIHGMDDPTKPGFASSTPVPVINRTGLTGEYDLNVVVKPEAGADMFTLWQRALRDECGLRLENAKAQVEILVVDAAEKTPAAEAAFGSLLRSAYVRHNS
jgi:uncharacterized protein (TIGR03435 family)